MRLCDPSNEHGICGIVVCRYAFGTGVVDYNRSVSRVGSSSSSTGTSRRSRADDAQEEAREAREEARQAREEARQTREQSQQALAYMTSWAQVTALDCCCCLYLISFVNLTPLNTLQQLTASLGPDVNIP